MARKDKDNEEIDEALKDVITSESGLPLDDTVDLDNLLQDLESENLSLKSEIEVLSNSSIVLNNEISSLSKQIQDLTILSQDITKCKTEEILNTEILGTIVSGKFVYNSLD